jgi:hypothetical protein
VANWVRLHMSYIMRPVDRQQVSALYEFENCGQWSIDTTRREMAALVIAGQVYLVPNGTTVTVLVWSVWHGWHKVRIVSAGTHIGNVSYILDQWTTFE